ncbi:MAG: pitrilysin family protein [Saprospiraceae bacterium]
MVTYEKKILDNGLRVVLHKDESTPMVAINILYAVGSKDEDPGRTGFSHLFEHLMFGGTENVKDFDKPIQLAGGENNAFTNSDITNYYDVVPLENLEVALWLEADRMSKMKFTEKTLKTQKKVVIEEFKETCLNEPYGDMWHHISAMLYPDHGYNWPTIGKEIKHIAAATLTDVQEFFDLHYRTENAILCICGNIDIPKTFDLVEKWFGQITNPPKPHMFKSDFPQSEVSNSLSIKANVPSKSIVMAFKMQPRMHPDYYPADLISDILSSGRSSRFFQTLVKEKELFSNIDAYISGTTDDGAFVIEGKLMEDTEMPMAVAAIWEELESLKTNAVSETELLKIKNKTESNLVFSETSVLSKAMSLAYYEYLGDIDLINTEAEMYNKVTTADILRISNELFQIENCGQLYYFPLDVMESAPILG